MFDIILGVILLISGGVTLVRSLRARRTSDGFSEYIVVSAFFLMFGLDSILRGYLIHLRWMIFLKVGISIALIAVVFLKKKSVMQ